MTAMLAAGAVFGLGLGLLLRGLWPGPAPLATRLAAVQFTPAAATRLDQPTAELSAAELAVGRWLLSVLDALGLPLGALRADLAITGRRPEDLAARKLLGALSGVLLAAIASGMFALFGIGLPVAAVATIAVGGAAAGFVAPDLAVRRQATARREEVRYAVATWLDLVAVTLAGGAGIEQAMTATARAGQGWVWVRLRDLLECARLAGISPWVALGELGEDIDVAELRGLASSLALAGTEGARVRRSLAAAAAGLRQRQAAADEQAAAQVTERLVLPLGLLLVAFICFLGFPAAFRLFAGI